MTFYLNGKAVDIAENADLTRRLLDVLRDDLGLMGSKEGCGEGECGACLVFIDGRIQNACLVPLANAIGHKVVTIEGFKSTPLFKEIAEAYHRHGAVQCGYCTPGMVMATADLLMYSSNKENEGISIQAIKEGLAGNLCRCTGYQTIFDAVKDVGNSGIEVSPEALSLTCDDDVTVTIPQNTGANDRPYVYSRPDSIEEALRLLSEAVKENRPHTIFAGGTDLMIRKRNWQGARRRFTGDVIFIQQIDVLKRIRVTDHSLEIGAAVTQGEVVSHPEVPEYIKAVVKQMGTPAIRQVATMGGNIVNGASVADTLVPWYALDASVLLRSSVGERLIPIKKFILGKYKTALKPDELMISIFIPLTEIEDFIYTKLGNRKASVLSKLSVLIIKERNGRHRIAIGAVNDTVIRDYELETTFKETGDVDTMLDGYRLLFDGHDDKRSTKSYREKVVLNIIKDYFKGE